MNHAVLYVRDARRNAAFYRDVLGFTTVIEHPDGKFAFLRAPASDNHHDIAFFSIGEQAGASTAGRGTVGLYHIAWEVPSLEDLEAVRLRLVDAGALVGASDHGANKSLYAKDPEEEHEAIVRPLDLAAEKKRYTDGGIRR
jgi:catechol-2,3-dioxygenase